MAAAPPPAPAPLVIPAGSNIALRIAETIDSTNTAVNQTFAAVVSRSVDDKDLQTLLPNGSPVRLSLTPEGSTWRLSISGVMLNGDSYLTQANLKNFQGALPGSAFPTANRPVSPSLSVAGERVFIPSGALVTYKLGGAMELTAQSK